MRTEPPARDTLEPIETASRDELAALQLERLKWTIGRAYDNVEAYRRKCVEAQVHPGDLRELSDLQRFPFTTKDDLRQHYPFGLFAVPREQLVRLHASSGTTGKPTVVGYTRADIHTWAMLMARSLRAAGARAGDILHNAYGYGLFTGGLGLHYGGERLGCGVVPVSGGMTQRQVQLIEDFGADVIAVTPSYMLAIGDEFERQGRDARATALRIGIHGAEPWTEAMRREIEARFDIDALNHYGLSEILGPGVATECLESKDGLTLWEDHFYPEIVAPDGDDVLAEDTVGELVLTTLSKEALPMVRYRTRDLTRLLPPTARSMRRCDRITGRSDDMLIIHGANVFPSQIEALILEQDDLAPHYVLELRKKNRLDDLTVVVEARAQAGLDSDAARAKAAQALREHIKAIVGVNMTVNVVATGGVERSLGKAQRVVDLREEA